jgi:hypothetical protein
MNQSCEATMKKLIFLLTAFLVMCVNGKPAYAAGELINLQFGGGDAATNGGAVNNVEGQYWNYIVSEGTQSLTNMVYADGMTTSTVSVNETMTTSTGMVTNATAYTGKDIGLMTGYFSTSDVQHGTFSFTGLTAGEYKVYVYSQRETGNNSYLNLGLTTAGHSYAINIANNSDLTGLTSGTGLNPAANWASQKVLVGADGTLNMTTGFNNAINGIQIEAVPEPGSVILLGVGGIFVLGALRIRAKEGTAVNA